MVNWDETAQKQLLLTVIHFQSTTTPDFDKVAAMMGDGYTASAVRQKFNKLKKDCREKFGELGEGGSSAGTGTPAKPRRAGKKAAGEKSSGKRKSTKDVEEEGVEWDDDEKVESPSKAKKMKVEKKEESDDEV